MRTGLFFCGSTTIPRIINNVAPGDYTVTELYTGAGEDAQIVGYTLNASVSDGGAVTVECDKQSSVTVTNEYTLKSTEFVFDKLWLPLASAADPDELQTWPAGATIWVELHRAASGDVDNSFRLIYSVTEKNGSLSYTLDAQNSTGIDDLDPGFDYLSHANDVYHFRMTRLPQTVMEGTHVGEDWTYYLTESNPDNYQPSYGAAVESGGVWQASVDPSAQNAQSGGAVINRQTAISLTVTKLWFTTGDWDTPVAWPKGENGKDVPITLTVSSSQTGASERSWTLTSGRPAQGDGYSMVRQGNQYVFTLNGLLPGYDYTVTEAAVGGYFTAYVLADGTRQQSGMHWTDGGGTIRNTVESFELPHTGGIGQILLPIFGGVLTGLPVLSVLQSRIAKRRRKASSTE